MSKLDPAKRALQSLLCPVRQSSSLHYCHSKHSMPAAVASLVSKLPAYQHRPDLPPSTTLHPGCAKSALALHSSLKIATCSRSSCSLTPCPSAGCDQHETTPAHFERWLPVHKAGAGLQHVARADSTSALPRTPVDPHMTIDLAC